MNQVHPFQVGSHRIHIDGEWEIRDLYDFPHRYAEVYSFLYALDAAENHENSPYRHMFRRYPWQGGYSAVNFYDELYTAIPQEHRPRVWSIRYASPGFIEIGAVVVLLTQIEAILTKAVRCWDALDRLYTKIHKRAMQRKRARLKLQEQEQLLEEEKVKFAIESCKELSAALGLSEKCQIDRLTGDPVRSLKILLAFYRRFRKLLRFVQDGKVSVQFAPLEAQRQISTPQKNKNSTNGCSASG